MSTSEIGKRLGISKNAVVGKLHRLGWTSRAGDAVADDKKSSDKKQNTTESKKKPVAKVTAKPVKQVKPSKKGEKSVDKPKVAPIQKPKRSTIRGMKESTVHQRMVQHALEMANLKPNQCRWPIGDPDSDDFHFCGAPVFVGKPYCYEHCKQAYQFNPPKKK